MKWETRTPIAVHRANHKHVVGAEPKCAQQACTGDFGLEFGVLRAILHLQNAAVRQLAMKLLSAASQSLNDEPAGDFVRYLKAARRIRSKIELCNWDFRLGPHSGARQRDLS